MVLFVAEQFLHGFKASPPPPGTTSPRRELGLGKTLARAQPAQMALAEQNIPSL